MRYRADIDGIRAIAVLLVVAFHFRLFAFGGAGFVGVDLFFVISGYLISGIICRDLSAGRFSLGHFYARRVRRLAPALPLYSDTNHPAAHSVDWFTRLLTERARFTPARPTRARP